MCIFTYPMSFFNNRHILGDKRYAWIDYDRGLSIILVTYRHVCENMAKAGIDLDAYPLLQYFNYFFFGFRMPLFFFASGLFFSKTFTRQGMQGYAQSRFQTILYPMLVWGCIQIGLQILFSDYTNSGNSISWHSFLDLLTDPRKTGQFWYLHALFSVGLLYAFIHRFVTQNSIVQILIGLVFYTGSAIVNDNGLEIYFLNDVLKYYLFFGIGTLAAPHIFADQGIDRLLKPVIILPLLLSFFSLQYLFTELNQQANSYYFVENHMAYLFLPVALVGCTVSIIFSAWLKRTNMLQGLRVIGYHSVHIYCMQIICMSVTRLVCIKFFPNMNSLLISVFMLLIGLGLPIIIYRIGLRIGVWHLFTLKKPQEDIAALKEPPATV